MPNLLFSSSDFEVVDGVLILVVKSDSNRLNLRGQSEDATSYKVRIEHTPKPRRPGVACLRAWDADWTFSCSCPSYARSAPIMCKYIGACLIVHFYQHKVHNVHIVHIAQSRTGSFKLKNTSVPLRSPIFVILFLQKINTENYHLTPRLSLVDIVYNLVWPLPCIDIALTDVFICFCLSKQ